MTNKMNKYVLPVVSQNGQELYFNTITKEKYFRNESDFFYNENMCYEGQELELIKKQLFKQPNVANFLVTNTWECSLRCGHCCVIDKLKSNETDDIDIDKFKKFLVSYRERYAKNKKEFVVYIAFAGGEPGLRPLQGYNQIITYKEVFKDYINFFSTCTTNLYYDLTEEHIIFFKEINMIVVSIDGLEYDHNKQRKCFGDHAKNGNPFQKTVENLQILIEKIGPKSIKVQASLKDEIFYDQEKKVAFFEYFIRKGMYVENISWNGLFPTRRNPIISQAFKEASKPPVLNASPCCKYRFMSRIHVDPNNKIYSDYFQHNYINEMCFLGTLDDDIEKIEEKYKNMILQEMPIMKDKNCMDCPVIGYCWGKCINANETINIKPSLLCNKSELIKEVFSKLENREIEDIK